MLNKQLLYSFIRSTVIVLIISFFIGLSVQLIGGGFLPAFILSACLQYVLFSFIANIVNNYYAQKTRQKELDKLEMLSTLLQCAYCQEKNVVTFLPDQTERIEMLCNKCSKKNAVSIGFTVARITDPVSTMPALPEPEKKSEQQ
jgi:hypothetical protein